MRSLLLTYVLMMTGLVMVLSQDNGETHGFWNWASVDGEVKLKGLYRHKYTSIGDFHDTQESMYFSGGLRLDTRSYIWHPSFLKLELGGEYFPETSQDDYVVTPDRAEVRTLKALRIGTVLFDKRPITLSSWADWNESFQNRENLTNINSKTRRLGSSLLIKNRILPLNLKYQDTKWDQQEIQTGRLYQTDQSNLEASTQKSFTSRDRNQLSYSHNRYFRRDYNLYQLENINDQLRLNNSIFLDEDSKYQFRSDIHDYRRRGSQNFHTFNLRESLFLDLPMNFRGSGSYNFYSKQEELQDMRQHKVNANLQHQLFESLHSGIRYEYVGTRHSRYDEWRNNLGFDLDYTKDIPTGQLKLYYHYSLLRNVYESGAVDLPVWNEAYQLADGEITMLTRPFVDPASVVVKDVTGTIIYQLDFDYLLIEQGDYIEVQRVPGGQIPNGGTVFIDYMARQTGSYSYTAHTHHMGARVILFKRFLELYYSGRYVDYTHIEKSDLLVLNYLKQNTYGALVRIWFAELGAEYEGHHSTITPYTLWRFYVNVQKRFGKIVLSVNGNHRNYYMIDDSLKRKYSDLSARWAYEFTSSTRLILYAGYRKQMGTGIDLNLLTASCEFRTRFRKLYLGAGIDLYRRDYMGDDLNYYGGFIQLQRKF